MYICICICSLTLNKQDGVVLFWDPAALDALEPTDSSPTVALEPLKEVRLGPGGVRIRTMEIDEERQFGEWIVMDDGKQSGGLWRVNWKDGMAATKLLDTHAGMVMCVYMYMYVRVCMLIA